MSRKFIAVLCQSLWFAWPGHNGWKRIGKSDLSWNPISIPFDSCMNSVHPCQKTRWWTRKRLTFCDSLWWTMMNISSGYLTVWCYYCRCKQLAVSFSGSESQLLKLTAARGLHISIQTSKSQSNGTLSLVDIEVSDATQLMIPIWYWNSKSNVQLMKAAGDSFGEREREVPSHVKNKTKQDGYFRIEVHGKLV